MTEIPLEKLVGVYIKMRTKKELLEGEAKQIDNQMREVKVAINDRMRETGLDSIRTAAGTAYRTVKTTYAPSDWGLMYQFILDHNMPELLEKRLHQGNVKKYLEENPEDVPPGLNSTMEYSVTVKGVKNAG
jgi:hypothetical protein